MKDIFEAVNPIYVRKHKVYTFKWDTDASLREKEDTDILEPVYLSEDTLTSTVYIDSSYVILDEEEGLTEEEKEVHPLDISYEIVGSDVLKGTLSIEKKKGGGRNGARYRACNHL